MKSKLELKFEAIELRKKGLSYKQIMEKLPVLKSSLSGWFKYLKFSEIELEKMRELAKNGVKTGQINASLSNRARRLERESLASTKASELFEKNKDNHLFIIGIALYWAEGSKRTGEFQFINSDADMIMFINDWIKLFMPKEKVKYRLFTHKIFEPDNLEEFWAEKLKVEPETFEKTIYKTTLHGIKKNPDYKGCLRISLSGINTLRTMKTWQKLFIMYYSSKLHP